MFYRVPMLGFDHYAVVHEDDVPVKNIARAAKVFSLRRTVFSCSVMELGGFYHKHEITREALKAVLDWWRLANMGRPKMIIATTVMPNQQKFAKILTDLGFTEVAVSPAGYSDSTMSLFSIKFKDDEKGQSFNPNVFPECEILGTETPKLKEFKLKIMDYNSKTHSNNHWGYVEPIAVPQAA
jgi:hypothetical protein